MMVEMHAPEMQPAADAQDAQHAQDGPGVAASDNGKMKLGMTRATLPKSIIPKFDAYRHFYPPSVTDAEVCDHLYYSDCHKTDCRKASIREIEKANKDNTTISGSAKLDKMVIACLVNKNQPDLGSSNRDSNTGTLANARSVTGCPKMVIRQMKAKRAFAQACAKEAGATAILAEYSDAELAILEDGHFKSDILESRKTARENKKEAMKRKRDAEADFMSAPEDLATKVSSLPNANRSHTDHVYKEFGMPLSKRQLRVPASDLDAFKTCVDHSFRKTTFSLQQEQACMQACLEIEDADDKEELQQQLKSAYDTILTIQAEFMARVMPTPPVFTIFAHRPLDGSELNVPEPPPEPAPEDEDATAETGPGAGMDDDGTNDMEVEARAAEPSFDIAVINTKPIQRFPMPHFMYKDDDELEEGEIRETEEGEIV